METTKEPLKVGQKVKVIDMTCGHEFNIGETVVINDVEIDNNEEFYDHTYRCSNGKKSWLLGAIEIELINSN